MSVSIAISGKGGSGKTTVAAMIVRHLVERKAGTVLAVDADPNSCLGLTLGLEPETTVAEIREQTLERKLDVSPGMSRERAFEYALHRAVAEARGFDLLVMGHPEGAKCYCAVNNLLRKYLDQATTDYAFVVIDNEAGMEHLSRRTTDSVDHLVVVTEPTAIGARTARRILGLSERLPITVGHRSVLWNKVTEVRSAECGMRSEENNGASGDSVPFTPHSALRTPHSQHSALDLPVLGEVPFDQRVMDLSTRGGTIGEIPTDNPAFRAVGDVTTKLIGSKLQVPGSKL